MAKNIGYLTSKHTPESDEVYTPQFVVDAIMKYIPYDMDEFLTKKMQKEHPEIDFGDGPDKPTVILCPFSKDYHAFPKVFRKNGYNVINSHYDPETGEGKDFFSYTKEDMKEMKIDYIIDNPPFSLKDKVLKHCEELGVAYALLLPLPTLQSNTRFKDVFSKGNTQALIFDKRVPYTTNTSGWYWWNGDSYSKMTSSGDENGITPDYEFEYRKEFPEVGEIWKKTYKHRLTHWSEMNGNHFASIFICKDVLPKDLIFDELMIRDDEETKLHVVWNETIEDAIRNYEIATGEVLPKELISKIINDENK